MLPISKWAFVALSTSILLVSCGKSADTNSGMVTESPNINSQTNVLAHASPDLDPAVRARLETRIQKIESAKNLEDLSDIISVKNDPKQDHPKFLEFQKKKLLLGAAFESIRTPKYVELEQQRSAIYNNPEFWTQELKDLDAKIKAARTNTGAFMGMKAELDRYAVLSREVRATPEYKAYLEKNKDKLAQLAEEGKKMMTPELLQLQTEVVQLQREIYLPADKKVQ